MKTIQRSRRGLLAFAAVAAVALTAAPAGAAENRNVTLIIQNNTSGVLSLQGAPLSWGKWAGAPPPQIAAGASASMMAEGANGTMTGTQGQVTYFFSDAQTTFTTSFDIPYASANSGWVTLAGPGMTRWTVNADPFPLHGNSVFYKVTVADAPH